jgi:AcrR family transcriptional regulator
MSPRDTEASADLRPRDPERTRAEILAIAREEFAAHGLSGARVDAIAARMRTTKRMIYYYFGSKEGLYLAVLEQAYAEIRAIEQELDLARLAPAEAIRRMIDFTFEYHESHPDFIRLVSIENINQGRYIAQSETIQNLNTAVTEALAAILRRGQEDGVFRKDIDAVDVHMLISAFCFFRVSNRHTFGALFRRDLSDPILRKRHKALIADAVLRSLEKPIEAGGSRRRAA